MATKKCPQCGKRIDAQAVACLYCSASLPAQDTAVRADEFKKTAHRRGKGWMIVTCVSLAVVAILVLAIILFPPPPSTETPPAEQTTTTVTGPTRDAARDAWLHTFTGRWYDEDSVGKSDIETMGGYTLFIHDILNDQVLFDLYAYSGGKTPKTAFVQEVAATLVEDTLQFAFANDALGHSGIGHMRFTDEGIQMEVALDKEAPAGEHSLAVNAVFLRSSAPSSKGNDIRQCHNLADIVEIAGRQTSDPVTDDQKNTTYTFGALSVIIDSTGALKRVTIDYALLEDRTAFCFDQIDGTMSYDTVKTYFGDAVHDYTEQPTDIRVLYYTFKDGKTVTFTFDATEDRPQIIQYCL